MRMIIPKTALAHTSIHPPALASWPDRDRLQWICSISQPVIADDDFDRLDVSAAGFAHADAADLFGDVVLGADNLE